MVGDPPDGVRKVGPQLPLPVEPHQVLAEIERPLRHGLGLLPEEVRILVLDHERAGRHRDDDVPPLRNRLGERREIRPGVLLGGLDVAHVEERHPATALGGDAHVHAVVSQNRHSGLPDIRRVVVDRARVK